MEIKSNSSNMNKKKLYLSMDMSLLPEDVAISTMTLTCKINLEFNVTNIAKYIDLKHNGIIDIEHGSFDDKTTNRSLIIKKASAQKKKKQKKAFYNQVSIVVKTKKGQKTNVKLFSNGAIQMTGCKSIDSVIDALTKIFNELKTVKAVMDHKTNKIVEKQFVSNLELADVKNVYDMKICMINSDFSMGFNIDRDRLFDLLSNDNIECSYDPIIHAGVNIKYEHREKTITILVFESGAVIITGARSCSQIAEAYTFINKYLLKNYEQINKNNFLTNSTILEFLNSDVAISY